ncbi:protein HBS1-like [Eriocheir sinensis]|uniref:protein HBS1-like n=1 Tax=Eriocheir sinensis TaxID=95602 RepID=UPI0021C77655|nr:protein HBS1-like [Eriocheir sinensis]
MSRHRDVRNLDYDEEYDEACDDNVYGHSVDDSEYGVSPGMEQYLYSRSRENAHGFGLYFSTSDDIKEEEETMDGTKPPGEDRSRHDSASSYEKPPLSPEDEVRLASVLDELRNILGDKYSEGELTQTVLVHNFHLESALNALLNRSASAASASPASPLSSAPPVFPSVRSSSSSSSTSAIPMSSSKVSSDPLPQREKRNRNRGPPTPPTEGIQQLTLTHNHGPPRTPSAAAPPPPAAAAAATPRAPPVVVSRGASVTPKVVRGFEVTDGMAVTPDGSQLAATADLEPNSKRSRSSTPVQAAGNGAGAAATATPNAAAKAPTKIRDKAVDVLAEYQRLRGAEQNLLNLVVVGHVDAGKSTLMGHLLYLRGTVAQRTMHKYEQESRKLGKQSFMYAWVLDDTEEERSRGITVDVAQRVFTTGQRTVTLLDAPGHRDFIPNMITGAARADAAVLAVDASTGAFEAGFDSGGQTREHALLVRSLGVSQLVVAVNKLDTTDWSEERMKEVRHSIRQFLKGVGFKDADVTYVPCSGLTGENLVERSPGGALDSWYSGPTLLEAIDTLKVPVRAVEKPVRMCVCDVYKGQGAYMCVSGRLDAGYLQANDRLLLLPQGDIVGLKAVQTDTQTDNPSVAFAGDHVTLTLSGVDPAALHVGDFLCDPMHPIPLTSRIQARIVVFNITVPLIKGAQLDFHYQSVTEPASIRKLVSQLHKTTGQTLKARPRALPKNSAALVELELSRSLCLELFRDFREMGRFMLRAGGSTVAAGLVTKILA